MPPLLEAAALRRIHDSREPGISIGMDGLILHPGEALGIVGPSGCGKSTLLEMLALLIRPSSAGRFLLTAGGRTHDLAALWEREDAGILAGIRRTCLGFVHQGGGLHPFLSVRDNAALPLRLNGCSDPAALARRLDDLLDFLDLRHAESRLPETLSYGERQRTAVARALAHSPKLVLADEPTSALDPDSAGAVMALLLEGARRSGAALVVVSHDHALLERAGIPLAAMEPAPPEAGMRRHILPAWGRAEALPQADVGHPAPCDPAEAPHGDGDGGEAEAAPGIPPGRAARMTPILLMLAWRDFLHERALSLCAVLAFAAALTPLLVLGGLRHGVVATFSQRILENPAALAVQPYGSRRYSEEDIARLRALPGAAFVVPTTRLLASSVNVARPDRPPVTVDVLPTAPGDPLILRHASVPEGDGAVITQELARSLPGVVPGSVLDLGIGRRFEGRPEQVRISARLIGILPDAADWRPRIYLPLPVLLQMERYRDGLAVPERGWTGGDPPSKEAFYAGFRMYVRGLDDVVPMRDALAEMGVEAHTLARDVETLQGLKRALTLIALLVGGVTLVGMALSLASLAAANVRRKAKFFAQGHLMGLRRGDLMFLPLAQMCLVALLAAACSLALHGCASALLDLAASPWLREGESACRLPAVQVLALFAGSFLLACLGCATACRHLLTFQPAEVLRRDS